MFSIPLAWAIGKPNRTVSEAVLRPVTRDGGARLNIRNRLYPMVVGDHGQNISANWPRYWR